MPQSRHPRAWVKDMRICKNCGHTRARHGGNVGKGAFGSKVYCVESIKVLYGEGDWTKPIKLEMKTVACACKTFVEVQSEDTHTQEES